MTLSALKNHFKRLDLEKELTFPHEGLPDLDTELSDKFTCVGSATSEEVEGDCETLWVPKHEAIKPRVARSDESGDYETIIPDGVTDARAYLRSLEDPS